MSHAVQPGCPPAPCIDDLGKQLSSWGLQRNLTMKCHQKCCKNCCKKCCRVCCQNVRVLLQGQQAVADAVLLLPPYYFSKVPDAGIEKFVTAVLQTTKLPCYLYNYSVHTGNVISVDSYKKLANQLPHLRGIKCTVTAMSDATPYKEALPHLQVRFSCMLKQRSCER